MLAKTTGCSSFINYRKKQKVTNTKNLSRTSGVCYKVSESVIFNHLNDSATKLERVNVTFLLLGKLKQTLNHKMNNKM